MRQGRGDGEKTESKGIVSKNVHVFRPDTRSPHKPKPHKIVLGPPGLVFKHSFEGFGNERVTRSVKGNRHAPAIGVTVVLMRTGLTIEEKAVSDKSRDQFPGSEASETSIIDRHRLDRDGHF